MVAEAGAREARAALRSIGRNEPPQLLSVVPENVPFGFAMFLLGWLAAGFGVVGQPHIMVRAMAVDSAENIASARRVYVVWNMLFSVSAVADEARALPCGVPGRPGGQLALLDQDRVRPSHAARPCRRLRAGWRDVDHRELHLKW